MIKIICNKCFSQGYFLNHMKITKFTQVFKAGDKKKFGNYRPILVLGYFRKIIAKNVVIQLTYLSRL